MRKALVLSLALAAVFALVLPGHAKEKEKGRGEELFKKHCAVCHPDGGNIVNPKKTLHRKDLETHRVRSAEDIMKLMRNPGPGMIKFDEKTISERDAKEIAEYVLKTFGK